MDYGMFEEALVDFFCRQSHDPAVARSRAAAVIAIAKSCDEEIVGMTLACDEVIPLAPFVDPHISWDEGQKMLDTIEKFLKERRS
jgi:hypothetical protein